MMNKDSRIIGLFFLLVLMGFLTACSQPAPEVQEETAVAQEHDVGIEGGDIAESSESATIDPGGAVYGGTLVVGMNNDPFVLDPIKDLGSDGNDVILGSELIESLIGIGQDGEMVPRLAVEMPEISDDGLSYTFKLRQGVKFHDGTDFNAEAVKFNWENLIDPEYGTRQAGRIGALVSSIDVLDTYTIQITFNEQFPDFLPEIAYRTWWRINSPAAVEELGSEYGIEGVVGTGPFKFKEWIQGDRLVLVRNEDYWDEGLPYLDEIIYRPIADPSVKMINLQAGEVDLLYTLPYQYIEDMRQDPNVEVLVHGSGINELIFLNTTLPIFQDIRVRQALSLAIDRAALNELVYNGLGEIPNGPFPSWHWAYTEDVSSFEYDPGRARELLEEAGYRDSNPLAFELRVANEPLLVDQATVIQGMWAEVGIQAELLPLDKATFWDPILGEKDPDKYSQFQAGLEDYAGGFPDVASYVEYQYRADGSLNTTNYNMEGGYQNPEVEQLIEEVVKTVDQEAAAELYAEITRHLKEDIPQIPLGWLPNVNVIRSHIHDFQVNSQNFMPLRAVWVEQQ